MSSLAVSSGVGVSSRCGLGASSPPATAHPEPSDLADPIGLGAVVAKSSSRIIWAKPASSSSTARYRDLDLQPVSSSVNVGFRIAACAAAPAERNASVAPSAILSSSGLIAPLASARSAPGPAAWSFASRNATSKARRKPVTSSPVPAEVGWWSSRKIGASWARMLSTTRAGGSCTRGP